MCLYSWQKRKKATKDIECYKIVVMKNGVIHSKYHDKEWEMNKLYEAEKASPFRIKSDGDVTSGYFHSYDSFEEVKRWAFCDKNEVVCKCIIPDGTYYYYGIHSDGHEGYASKKLKITEIISEYHG